MEKHIENEKKPVNQDFISEYTNMFKNSTITMNVKTEWVKKGDFFQKLSMYDDSYSPVKTLGNTTLIKAL